MMTNECFAFAEGFLDEKGSMIEKTAAGMKAMAAEMPIRLEGNGLLAAAMTSELPVNYTFGGSVVCDKDRVPEELYAAMEPYIVDKKIGEAYTEAEAWAQGEMLCWGGGWGGHSNPEYGMLLSLGTGGLRERLALYKKLNPGREGFYRALSMTLDALEILGERTARLALEEAEKAEGERKNHLLRLAGAASRVPKAPANDFYEAVVAFWLAFTFDGVDSPGRFDQYMRPYYEKSDPADARNIMEALWEEFYRTRTWNLCLSGSDADWNDQTSDLTYLVLDCAEKARYNTPNLTLRVHRNTPEKLYHRASEVIATGIGMPALYNDEAVVPALEELGIPSEDAHRYCMNGCNQIDIMGRSHMGLEDGEVSLIKCLELALNGGVSTMTGRRLGPETPTCFQCFEDVYAAYRKQVEAAVDMTVAMANRAQALRGRYGNNPLRSHLILGCVEKGVDYRAGGPIYNHGQILTEGLADTADALAAIRHFAFATKEIPMETLRQTILDNFEGHEAMRIKLRSYQKFGNDADAVDELAADIQKHFFSYLLTKRTWRGGIYGGGLSTFNRTASYGQMTGANANGRKSGDAMLADSIGAEPGMDRNGPTAAILSAAKYDQSLAKSGFVFHLKFEKSLFATENGLENFITLWKTYFRKGGQQLSVNVVSRDELLDARVHPENHRNLIVRVGGYSEYFWKLPDDLQENIIERSGFAV